MINSKHPLATAFYELERAFDVASTNAAIAHSENRHEEAKQRFDNAAAYHRGMMCLKYLSEHEQDYSVAVGAYIEQPV